MSRVEGLKKDWSEFLKGVSKTKVFRGTWLDRQGESYEYLLEKKDMGLRVDVHTWLDTNEVVIRLIEGDGRTIHFKEYKAITLHKPSDEQIKTAILDMMRK